jgi:hypothetical protein
MQRLPRIVSGKTSQTEQHLHRCKGGARFRQSSGRAPDHCGPSGRLTRRLTGEGTKPCQTPSSRCNSFRIEGSGVTVNGKSACARRGTECLTWACPANHPCPRSPRSRPAAPSRSRLAWSPSIGRTLGRSNSIFGVRLQPPQNATRRSKQPHRVGPRLVSTTAHACPEGRQVPLSVAWLAIVYGYS